VVQNTTRMRTARMTTLTAGMKENLPVKSEYKSGELTS
jgi:hypothetical protein